MNGADRTEALRKGVHLGCLLFALLLRWLPWKGALLMAVGALLSDLVAVIASLDPVMGEVDR